MSGDETSAIFPILLGSVEELDKRLCKLEDDAKKPDKPTLTFGQEEIKILLQGLWELSVNLDNFDMGDFKKGRLQRGIVELQKKLQFHEW